MVRQRGGRGSVVVGGGTVMILILARGISYNTQCLDACLRSSAQRFAAATVSHYLIILALFGLMLLLLSALILVRDAMSASLSSFVHCPWCFSGVNWRWCAHGGSISLQRRGWGHGRSRPWGASSVDGCLWARHDHWHIANDWAVVGSFPLWQT